MTQSTVVTEEPLRERPADVVTADGPTGDEPAVHETDVPAGRTAAPDATDAELDDEHDDEGDEGQESGDERPPRRSKSEWQKSVDRLTRQRAEERRAREEAELRAAEERGRRLALEELAKKRGLILDDEPEQGSAQPATAEEPQPEDFDTVEEYAKAFSKWEREQAAPAKPAANEPEQPTSYQPSSDSAEIRRASYEAAVEAFPDFEERLEQVGPRMTVAMVKAIEFDEDGASIVAHLADHPEELERIAKLTSEAQVAKALQRFAGKVLASAPAPSIPANADKGTVSEDDTPRAPRQPKAAPVTRAKPVGTVLSGGRVSVEPDIESMSQDEYEAYMNRKERQGR